MRRRDFIKAIAGSTVVRPLAAGAAALPAPPTLITLVPGKLTVCTYGGFAPVCYRVRRAREAGDRTDREKVR
jgi:hypothetical protein